MKDYWEKLNEKVGEASAKIKESSKFDPADAQMGFSRIKVEEDKIVTITLRHFPHGPDERHIRYEQIARKMSSWNLRSGPSSPR